MTLKLTGCKLTSGVAFADVSDATEFTEDREERTSDTGATPKEDSISSKSLEKKKNIEITLSVSTSSYGTNAGIFKVATHYFQFGDLC